MSKPKCYKSNYAEQLKDPRWQRKRLEVMNRDGFKCRDCDEENDTLQVHHCFYAKGGPWNTPSHLLLTLCEACHEIRQTCEDDARNMLGMIMSKCPDIESFTRSLHAITQEQEKVLFLYSDNTVMPLLEASRKELTHV